MLISLATRGVISNDPSAALSNASIIQQAIDDAGTAGFGTVEFDVAGEILVSFSSSIGLQMRSNVVLRGNKEAVKLKLDASSANAHLINMDNLRFASIIDLAVDGNREAFPKTGPGVHCIRTTKGSYGLTVKGCLIRGAIYYGIGLQWSADHLAPDERFLIAENHISQCGGWSSAGTTYGDAIDIKYGLDGVVRDNVIDTIAQRGIDIRGIGHRVYGNRVKTCASTGISIRGNNGPLDANGNNIPGLIIINPGKIDCFGNSVLSCGSHGIVAFEEAPQTNEGRYVISNNLVEGCGGAGITVSGPANRIRAMITGNVTVSNTAGTVVIPSGYTQVGSANNKS